METAVPSYKVEVKFSTYFPTLCHFTEDCNIKINLYTNFRLYVESHCGFFFACCSLHGHTVGSARKGVQNARATADAVDTSKATVT